MGKVKPKRMTIKLIKKRIKTIIRSFVIFLIVTIFLILTQRNASGQIDLDSLKNLYQQRQYQEIIDQLDSSNYSNSPLIQEYLASSYEQTGQLNLAIFHWQKARQLYQEQGQVKKASRLQLVQAQLEIEIGKPLNALDLLENFSDSSQIQALKGNAFLVLGDYSQAIAHLETALEQPLNPSVTLSVLTNLSKAYQKNAVRLEQQKQLLLPDDAPLTQSLEEDILKNQQQAKITAKKALRLAQTVEPASIKTLRAWLNWLSYRSKDDRLKAWEPFVFAAKQLPSTHETLMLWLNLGELVQIHPFYQEEALKQAIAIGTKINDYRGLAIATGKMGHYFELQQDYELALVYTQKAQKYAYQQVAYDQLYRWQWQEGRIDKVIGNKEAAKLAYQQAIYSLNRIRNNLITASRDVQFEFQKEIEPVYRDYLALLLENPRSENLETVTEIFGLLQLAKLENLFQDICFDNPNSTSYSLEILEKNKIAVINTVILPNALHVILRLPKGSFFHVQYALSESEIEAKLKLWKEQLINVQNNQYLSLSKYFYNLLIFPFSNNLSRSKVDSLLFINDGLFKNLPMSALWDTERQEFLFEKYSISHNLGYQFIESSDKPRNSGIYFGLSLPRPPINQPLPNVINELQEIKNIFGGKVYLNQDFTEAALIDVLKTQSPEILHLATHGNFTGIAQTTYLQFFDNLIDLNDFDAILKFNSNLKFLILSACDTATGNQKAVLGLAGIAIKNGIPHTLGTLWKVQDDTSSKLIQHFYDNLKQNILPSKALQLAQIQAMKESRTRQHPRNWSPFLLIGI